MSGSVTGRTLLGFWYTETRKGTTVQFQLTMSLDNDDAVQGGPDAIAGYLRDVASHVQAGYGNGNVRDVNGNTIGRYDITDQD